MNVRITDWNMMVNEIEEKEDKIKVETWRCFWVGISIPILLICSWLCSLAESTSLTDNIVGLTIILALILLPISIYTGLPSLVSVIKNKSPDQNSIEILLVFIGAVSPMVTMVIFAYYILNNCMPHIHA